MYLLLRDPGLDFGGHYSFDIGLIRVVSDAAPNAAGGYHHILGNVTLSDVLTVLVLYIWNGF